MKKVFFSFSGTARQIMEGELTIEEVEVLVANTAAPDAESLAQGYAYMGEEIKNISYTLFPKMVQYRLAPSFVDYFCDKKGKSIVNVTCMFPRVQGNSFKEIYQKAWELERRFPIDEEELTRSRDYWDKIFTECGLL